LLVAGSFRIALGIRSLIVLGLAAGCNALTGVEDLRVASCSPSAMEPCPSNCSGMRTCNADGAWSDTCDCDGNAESGTGGGAGAGGPGGSNGSGGTDEGMGGSLGLAGASGSEGTGCPAGTHACGETCSSNLSVSSCGTSCTPCPVPSNATATCDGTSCGVACPNGYRLNLRGPDAGMSCCEVPPGAVCDHLTDCGCAAAETCTSDSFGIRSCRPVLPQAVAPYGACNEDAECGASHSCINSACGQHCRSSLDCGWAGAECLDTFFSGEVEPVRDFATCTRNCDPRSPSTPGAGFEACGAGVHCSQVSTGSASATCFGFPGNIPAGGTCLQFDNECEPGLFCNQSDFLCTPWCEVGGPLCPSGLACASFGVPLIFGDGREFGGCLF
jgi:hypothetical protein